MTSLKRCSITPSFLIYTGEGELNAGDSVLMFISQKVKLHHVRWIGYKRGGLDEWQRFKLKSTQI